MREPICESQKSSINFRHPKTKLIKFFLTNMMSQRLCYLDYWLIEVMLGEGEDFTFYFLIIIDSLLLLYMIECSSVDPNLVQEIWMKNILH